MIKSFYTLLQVSCDSNLQAYAMFIYLKRQIKLTSSTKIQEERTNDMFEKYYLFFTFVNKKLIQMSTFVNKFRFFIYEIFIISKFDNPQLFGKA